MTDASGFRVGLVGCGHISSAHLHGWTKAPKSQVHTVFDLNEEVARETARRHRIPHVATSYADLVSESDIVDICTPPAVHAGQLAQALEASKQVLIEKPVVLSAAEWDDVSARVSATDSKIAVVHHLKFTDSVLRARRWIDEGRIGRVLRIHSLFLTDPKHDRMLTSDDHWSRALPGGRWIETVPHNLYLIHSFAGPLSLESVTALSTSATPAGLTADEVSVTLRNDSSIATIQFSAHCGLNVRKTTVLGSRGIIELDLLGNLATLHRIADRPATRAVGRDMLEAASQVVMSVAQRPRTVVRRLHGWTPYAELITAFERFVAGVGPSPTPLAEIDYVVRTAELIGREIDARSKR